MALRKAHPRGNGRIGSVRPTGRVLRIKRKQVRALSTVMKTLGPSRIDLTNSPFGQSEMAGRIREFDWSKTSLGSSENWPQHLRDAVETVVSCGFSATLQWGREATLFYNDAYIPLIGSKQPKALGRSIL